MSRNSGGTHTLPAGNPVVTGTTISSSWANTTLSDISTEITNSLDRGGRGAMTAGLPLFAGTVAAPGLTFNNDLDTGLYEIGPNNPAISANGTKVQEWAAAASTVTGALTVTAGVSVTQSTANTDGISSTGNGTGDGLQGTGGATGAGLNGIGGATSGSGVKGTGTAGNSLGVEGVGQGSASGTKGTGGATGAGVEGVGGATSGSGVKGTGTNGNAKGVEGIGQGSGSGVHGTAGSGDGATGVATSGIGVRGSATTGIGGRFETTAGSNPGILCASSGGPAIQVSTGHAYFAASNPAATTGFSNMMTPANVPKAWGSVAVTGAAASLEGGFNVASVAISGNDIVVTIADDMANANYAVMMTAVSVGGVAFSWFPVVNTRAVGSFKYRVYADTGAALNPASDTFTTTFVVFGLQ